MDNLFDYLEKMGAATTRAQDPAPFGLRPPGPRRRDDTKPSAPEQLSFGFKQKPATDHEKAWETWSASARGPQDNVALLEALGPIVDKAVTLYAGAGDPVAKSRARMLALKAAAGWDRKRSNLQTHLLTQLQPLRRYAASRRYATKVPERAQWQMQRLRDAEAEMRDELDRDASEIELADRTGLSVRRIGQLRRYGPQVATGSFLESEYQPVVEDDKPDEWRDFVYNDLGAADRAIFEGRTGYNGRKIKSVSELAKELGISAGTISKRAAKIAEMLADRPKGW